MKTVVRTSVRGKSSVVARLKIGKIFSLPEPEFARLILEIENDPLYKKLIEPADSGPKAVFKKRYPHTRLSGKFYELNEEAQSGSANVDVESLLSKHKGVIALIKKIGEENFEKFFLYQEVSMPSAQIAEICGIALEEVQKIQSLILEVSIHSEFVRQSKMVPTDSISYTPIAKVEAEPNGALLLSFFSPHLAWGRYIINHERVDSLKREMSHEERKGLTPLLKKIEWINLRQDTLHKTLNELILRQEAYLKGGGAERLLPLSQRAMARELVVAPSTICRLVVGKSLILPWEEEKPLKDLFLSRKEAIKNRLRRIWNELSFEQKKKISDNDLRELLMKQARFKISRRSINLYRREIEKEDEK